MNWKWLRVPSSNSTRDTSVPRLWEVRWQSRSGDYSTDLRPEMEAFVSQEEAEAFAQSLTNAFALLRHTSGNKVSVKQAKR